MNPTEKKAQRVSETKARRMREMLATGKIVVSRRVSIPVMSDADTGYGNAVTVYHTVRYFEEAGVVGINIEDQVSPKRCGHMRGKELISAAEMAKKIESAIKARRDPDFIINARTDTI